MNICYASGILVDIISQRHKGHSNESHEKEKKLGFYLGFLRFFFSWYFIYLAIALANITNHFRENWSIFHCCKLFEKCLLFNRYRWIQNVYRLSSGGKSTDDNGIYHVPSKHWNERNALIFMIKENISTFDIRFDFGILW